MKPAQASVFMRCESARVVFTYSSLLDVPNEIFLHTQITLSAAIIADVPVESLVKLVILTF